MGFADQYRSFAQGRVTPGPGRTNMSDQTRPSGSLESNPATAASTEQRSLRADLLKMILRKEAERRGTRKPKFEIKPRARVEWRYGA